jgi:hypothetical protein
MDCLPCILQIQGVSKVTYIRVQKTADELLNNCQRWDSNQRHRNEWCLKPAPIDNSATLPKQSVATFVQ